MKEVWSGLQWKGRVMIREAGRRPYMVTGRGNDDTLPMKEIRSMIVMFTSLVT